MIRRDIRTVGLIGAGVIGSGWATRALAGGLDVVAMDVAPDAEFRLRAAVTRAWPAARKLGLFPGADPSRLRFVASVEEVAAGADFIQESVPERESTKVELLSAVDAAAAGDVLIVSSSSGLLPSRLQRLCGNPERVLIGHPFNPVYLLPLVEVVGGAETSDDAIDAACSFYRELGMHPLRVRSEIDGYLSDRLQEALWRESLHLVNDGVATTDELDQAIVYGPGLRWAGMGTNLTFHLAGGEEGMRHTLAQFGPTLKLPWTRLEAPELTEQLVEAMVDGTARQAGERSIAELERSRDDYLVSVMRALRAHGVGAGEVLAAHEARVLASRAPQPWTAGVEVPAPLELYRCMVEPEWVDYNGHMTESAYLLAFGWASDALFRYIGIDEAYRRAGHSFYTVETHINYFREANVDESLRFTTQVLGVDTKRLHFAHAMFDDETGAELAAAEQMLVHVKLPEGKGAPILESPAAALAAVTAAHRVLPVPKMVGRTMKLG